MEIILCDDDERFSTILERQIRTIAAKHKWEISLQRFRSPVKALHFAENAAPSKTRVYFLDIEMPGFSGFQLAEKLKALDRRVMLVFVSGKDDLVFTSLYFRPIYFLRKARLDEELEPQLLRLYTAIRPNCHRVIFAFQRKSVEVIPEEISYIESDRNYMVFHTYGDVRKTKIRVKMKELEADWAQYGFIRTHKGYLVNRACIQEHQIDRLLLKDGSLVDIGKTWAQRVKDSMEEGLE